jgi:hypothetical protein
MTDFIQPALMGLGLVALLVGTFWLGKQWTVRKAMVGPDLLKAAGELVSEAMRLQQADPAAQAQQEIAKATFNAHLTALKAILNQP